MDLEKKAMDAMASYIQKYGLELALKSLREYLKDFKEEYLIESHMYVSDAYDAYMDKDLENIDG